MTQIVEDKEKLKKRMGNVKVLSGNHAAAWAVKLCRLDVIAAYPVTPQTPLVEELNRFRAEGELSNTEMVDVESENSAMAVIFGASIAGGRAFTATSSFGLVYMYDIFTRAAGHRQPVVLVNANREPPIIGGLARGRTDMLMMGNTGWIQLECENNQEIYDTVLSAFRLGEDADVLLPVMVSYDGWYISFLLERVELATQENVDKFLAPVANVKRLVPTPGDAGERRLENEGLIPSEGFTDVRLKHGLAMEAAKDKYEQITKEFEHIFGRKLVGQVEAYKMEDAEIALVAMGGEAMTAKSVVDQKREQGMKVGLVRVKMFRPCPQQKLLELLKGMKAIGVLEQGIYHGFNRGYLFTDLKTTLYDAKVHIPLVNFFAGMNGGDITVDYIGKSIDITAKAAKGAKCREDYWLNLPWLYEDDSVFQGK
ncbi:MAG: pyruvate synthase subunit PorA [Chloroflexi bacterium]|nr:pyruvate synthase subunit PorA [Chloroflexota bacterium]